VRRFSFVHAADLGLDLPFEGVSRTPPRINNVLCEASVGAWDELVRLCIRRNAAFLVLSGGLHGGRDFGIRARARLSRGFHQLCENGVQVYVALGSNDPTDEEWNTMPGWPGGVTVFPASEPRVVSVLRNGEHIATVVGQSHGANWNSEHFARCAPNETEVPVIAALPYNSARAGIDTTARANGGRTIDYWALGESAVATRQSFHPWIVEPGTVQGRRATRPDHLGPKGAMIADVHDKRIVAVELGETDRVRCLHVEVPTRNGTALRDEIIGELHKLRASHGGRGLLVELSLKDAMALPEGLDTMEVLAEVRAATSHWDPFVWCTALRVRGPQTSHRDEVWFRDEVAAAVVQEGRALLGNPLQRSYFLAERLEPLLRRWTTEMQIEEAEKLIDEATDLAVDSLMRESGH
jgi:exonuclease SbcD